MLHVPEARGSLPRGQSLYVRRTRTGPGRGVCTAYRGTHRSLLLLIVDATDVEGTLIDEALRDVMPADAPVLLAVTKADLLPRLRQQELAFVRDRARARGIGATAAYAVSAVTGDGVAALAEAVVAAARPEQRNVVVCGAASVGKSTLINVLSREVLRLSHQGNKLSHHVAAKALVDLTESELPGTTLGAIDVKCFASLHQSLYDTPGVVQPHAISYSLFPAHLMAPLRAPTPLAPRRALRMRAGDALLLEAAWMDGGATGAAGAAEVVAESAEAAAAAAAEAAAAPMLLARVDVTEADIGGEGEGGGEDGGGDGDGDVVWARVLCPPSVRARVVRASAAPEHAAPRPSYVDAVCSQLTARGNQRDAAALAAATPRRRLASGSEVASSPSA